MNYEDFQNILPYLYLGGLSLSVYALYGYLWHMYRGDKKGDTDYENLANLALDDEIDSKTINTSKKVKK